MLKEHFSQVCLGNINKHFLQAIISELYLHADHMQMRLNINY
jgi:hypothetical protein